MNRELKIITGVCIGVPFGIVGMLCSLTSIVLIDKIYNGIERVK